MMFMIQGNFLRVYVCAHTVGKVMARQNMSIYTAHALITVQHREGLSFTIRMYSTKLPGTPAGGGLRCYCKYMLNNNNEGCKGD